ncbi:MAG: outer membrane beta-barrel protein [Elusimicrobiota bacterium]
MSIRNMRSAFGALLAVAMMAGQTRAAEGPDVSGFVDFGYNYNLDGLQTNALRSFDTNANSFTLQNAEIVVGGKSDSDVSYRVDVNYGFDATITQSAGAAGAASFGGNQIDLQQAYLSKPCPWTGGTITAGKFVTPFGAEVIEAKDNFNTSRGLLFNFAIPFTHTGIKYDKGFGDMLSLAAGVVNGWDNLQDNNKGKSVFAQVGVKPSDTISLLVGGIHGPEQSTVAPPLPSIEKNGRGLVDTVLTVKPMDNLTLVANHDWGVEEGLAFDPVTGGVKAATWQGLGLHGKYAFSETFAGALRWETLDDNGLSRTGVGFAAPLPAGTDPNVTLNSITATLECSMNDVITRLEYRQDGASKKVFLDDKGKAQDSQSTVGVQWIYAFGG